MFDSNTKINCINKNLANRVNLTIRQDIFILLIEVTNARTCFENIIKNAKVLIKKVVIYISIFVVSRLNYKILLEQSF